MSCPQVKIGEAFELIRNGVSIKQEAGKGGIPITRIETIASGIIDTTKLGYADVTSDAYAGYYLREGDILMSHINSWAHLGKTALVRELSEPIIHGMNLLLLRASPDQTDATYAKHYFTSSAFKAKLHRISNQSVNQSSFAVTKLKELTLPLPSLPIQRRIAATLDKADALRRKNQEILQKYNELTRSIFHEMFGDPIENYKNWKVTSLGELGSWRSGGTPSRADATYFQGTIPWLSSGELEQMYIGTSKEHITEEAVRNSAAKIVSPGSLLLGMYDTAALKSSITTQNLTCNQAIAFAKLDDGRCSTPYVYFYIQFAKEHLKRGQRGVRQKNLNLSMIKELPVIMPPLDLQREFEHQTRQILLQKRLAQKAAEQSEHLFTSLLSSYFE
ncbi:restriction endonuclease subunit S [Hymenobacter coalescens]